MRTRLILPLATLALLAACNSNEPEAPAAPASESAEASSAPSPPPAPSVATPADFTAMDLPPALHGRWGMVAADCEPGRADAKGLLEIGPRRLKFYESVGTLAKLTEMEPTRIRGAFNFMGEGMTWDRDVTLDVQDGGKVLIRREYGDNAEPGPFRYTKCA